MPHVAHPFTPPAANTPPADPPNLLDWLGLASLAGFMLLGLLTAAGVDTFALVRPPDATWALYVVFVGGSVSFVLAIFAVMRLATKGWLRRQINRSRYYAHATLALYWSVTVAMTLALAALIADGEIPVVAGRWFDVVALLSNDGKKIAFADQPIVFSALVAVALAFIIYLLVVGSLKFSARRYPSPVRR